MNTNDAVGDGKVLEGEDEVIIRWAIGDKEASVYAVAARGLWSKCEELGGKLVARGDRWKEYMIPIECIKIGKSAKRILTEEQKKVMRERMKHMRKLIPALVPPGSEKKMGL